MSKVSFTTILKISILSILLNISTIGIVAYSANETALNYPIDTINGVAMYRYAVEKGEGLYRVSTKFGVSQDIIMQVNPGIKADGLRLGQVIYIPVSNNSGELPAQTTAQTNQNTASESDISEDTLYIYHTIQKKETLFGLSKRYGVPISQLEELNPKLVPKLPAGKVLRIPRTIEAQKAAIELGEPQVISEQVTTTYQGPAIKEGEQAPQPTDSISLIIENEGIMSSQDMPQDSVSIAPQPVTVWSDSYPTDFLNLRDSNEQIPMRIAYLLPMMLDASKRNANMDRFLEFYEGALLAINDLQKQGLRIESYIYDIEKNDITLQATLQNPALKMADAIIGPAYPAQVDLVAQFAHDERIPAIIPFTPNINGLDTNAYLLRFNLSTDQDVDLIIKYLDERKNDIHVVLVDLERDEEYTGYKLLSEQLKKSRVTATTTKMANLKNALKEGKENILMFSSNKIQDIQVYFSELSSLAWDYDLGLIGQYGWGKSEIPVKMYYTSVFDANDTRKEDLYIDEFNLYYNYPLSNTRPRYDMLGYDITVFTLRMLYENQLNNEDNKSIQEIIPSIEYKGIQSDIRFNRINENGGFVNHGRIAERQADR